MIVQHKDICLDAWPDKQGNIRRGCYRVTYKGELYAFIEMKGRGVHGNYYIVSNALQENLLQQHANGYSRALRLTRDKDTINDYAKVLIKKGVAKLIESGDLKPHSELTQDRAAATETWEKQRAEETAMLKRLLDCLRQERTFLNQFALTAATIDHLLKYESVSFNDLKACYMALVLRGEMV